MYASDISSLQTKTYPPPTLASFDLHSYLEGYKGTAKIRRAIYMAEHCPELSTESYLVALDELESTTYNTRLHSEVSKRLAQLGVALPSNSDWKRSADQMAMRENSELQEEIKESKSGNLLPACQRAHKNLAELYAKMGNIEEAFRVLQSVREFCGDATDHGDLQVSAARIAQSNFRWMQVSTFVQRAFTAAAAKQGAMWIEGTIIQTQASFGDSKWHDVARTLSQLSISEADAPKVFEAGNVTQRDLALYATLSALMTMSRKEIKEKLINNLEFSKYFEEMPECLELLKDFYASKYSKMLVLFDQVLSACALDPVIGPHIALIKGLVVDNIVVLYTTPYMSVRLESMAKELRIASVDTLESIVIRLITNKRIVARIDAVSGYLYKYTLDPRDATLAHIEEMYKAFAGQVDMVKAHIMFLEEESRRPSGSRSQKA
ncbi:cop9 signalosome complex subunit [Coemansia sp. RSA 986]|nr:cop9 signalosome complex subunit [Coemansia sp. RSA 986]